MNQRKKGSRGEHKAIKVLERWTNKEFARTPASGGLHWNLTQACGDIICLKEGHWFPFSLEVKNYGKIDFSHLIYDVDSDIFKFWEQCVNDSKEARKIPMLMMRYDRLPKEFFFVVLSLKVWNHVEKEFGNWQYIKEMDLLYSRKRKRSIVILRSDQFFKIPYKQLRQHLLVFKKLKR